MNTTESITTSNSTMPPDVSMVVRGSVIGALVLVVIISLAVVSILCKIVLDNRRMKRKIKSRKRLTSVTNCSTDGSVELGDNDSLVDNEAYVSSTQVIETPMHASNTMKELSVRPYSTVDNQAYGSAERDTVFTCSNSTYEYI